MKKVLYTSFALALAALSSGCVGELPEPDPQMPQEEVVSGEEVTLTLSAVTKTLPDDPATKIAFGTTDANWEEGDKIYLIKADGTTITLTLYAGAGTPSGDFRSTDPVEAGTYTPYAVSAASLDKGYVRVDSERGNITLSLSKQGGGTLAEALEHDILKGTPITLETGQRTATLQGINTHMLSYLRFRFKSPYKAIKSIGMKSDGGIATMVTFKADGTVQPMNADPSMLSSVSAAEAEPGVYAGYFAVYGGTSISLMARAGDVSNKFYTRLVSVKTADYEPGKVYGRTFSLSEDMVTSPQYGQTSSQSWIDLGLSVRWAKLYYGASDQYEYIRNVEATSAGVPEGWDGWRLPTETEVNELFYASSRQWVTSEKGNAIYFNCNYNTTIFSAGGSERYWDNGDTNSGIGTVVKFYTSETQTDRYGNHVFQRVSIGDSGNSLSYAYVNVEGSVYYYYDTCAMRLVCDYQAMETDGNTELIEVGEDSYDDNDFE